MVDNRMHWPQTTIEDVQSWLLQLQVLEETKICNAPQYLRPYHLATLALLMKECGAHSLGVADNLSTYANKMRLWPAIGLQSPLPDYVAEANALYEIQQRLMETQSAALQAMEENTKLTRRVQELESAAAEKEDWKAEAAQYELTQIAPGISAFTERGQGKRLADAVKLCANCFGRRQMSILQMQQEHSMRLRSLNCAGCKDKLTFRYFTDEIAAAR